MPTDPEQRRKAADLIALSALEHVLADNAGLAVQALLCSGTDIGKLRAALEDFRAKFRHADYVEALESIGLAERAERIVLAFASMTPPTLQPPN